MLVYPSSAVTALGFDAVLETLRDYVVSSIGLELLDAEDSFDEIGALREALNRVAEFQALLRFDDPFNLTGIADTPALLANAGPQGSYLEGEGLRLVLASLACARITKSYLHTRNQKYPLLAGIAESLASFPDLEKYIESRIDERGEVREDATPRLRELNRRKFRIENSLRRAIHDELKRASESGHAADSQPTVRGGRMVLPIRAEAKRKVQGFVHDESATGHTVFIEPASCLEGNNELVGIEAEIRREIVAVLRETTSEVVQSRREINANASILAVLDVLAAKAKLANRIGGIVPTVTMERTVELIDARNPELALAASSGDATRVVIPLTLKLGGDDHTLIITGPNAGGKTVALKTIGLFALLLAHGIPVPADDRTVFPFTSKLLVDIGDEQSIENDLSTYSAHIVRMAGMIEKAGSGSIVLIDEAGTGTDPVEGGAIAQAALESLGASGALTVATTHHNSLKAFAHDTPGIVNGSMVFDVESLSPTFRFRMGIPGSSYGLEIARRSGLSDSVLLRARELVGEDTRSVEDLLNTLEARLQGLQEQQERYERSAGEAEHSKEKYESRATQIKEERERIIAAAHAEAAAVLKSANARVENTIREIREAQADKDATRRARALLDDAREKEEEKVRVRVERKAKKQPRRDAGAEPIAVGDQVLVDDGSTAVEVLAIDGKSAEVAFAAGRMRVSLDRLRKVAGKRAQRVDVRRVQETTSRGDLTTGIIEQRLDVRGARVDEALGKVTRLVDEAVAAGLDSVEILHGKGTGALRAAIRENLLARRDVRAADDAPFELGGSGVTVVALSGS